jgi:hypothetical protein
LAAVDFRNLRMHPLPDRLLRTQAGIVTRAQLLAAGWSSSAVGRAVASGRLLGVTPGVYRVAGAPWSRRCAQWAALLSAGPGSALARWSAAEAHGFAEPQKRPVDVIVPPPRRGPAQPAAFVRVHRSRTLRPDERCEVAGLVLTTGARTLLDLAACGVARSHLGELMAGAVRVGACDLDGVARTLERHPFARGRRQLCWALTLLADDGTAARSDVEIATLMAIVEAGLPRPQVAHRVFTEHGKLVAEVDLAYPQQRIAIEIDGYRWHSTPAQKRRDEQRQNQLILLGWRVLRFSASEVRRRPDVVVAAVRRALQDAR